MIELIYNFNHPIFTPCTYKVIQLEISKPFTIFSVTGIQIATIEKVNGKWEQTGGRQMLDEAIEGAGKMIDDYGKSGTAAE